LPLALPFSEEPADGVVDPLDPPEHAATRTAIAATAEAATARRRQAGAKRGLLGVTPPRRGAVLVDLMESPR
jgi:hypothetical protein